MKQIQSFTSENLHRLFDKLARKEKIFAEVIREHGYPPLWVRPNTFETLVLTILEQQVSLASAYAAFKKLKDLTAINPPNILSLTDEQLRSCYFSRQKIVYVRGLATAILENKFDLQAFETMPDVKVRQELKQLKGIGDWTVDIYLIHALRRTDIFPIGDLALINAIRSCMQIPDASKEELLILSEKWKPLRSIATMLFWHWYIKKRGIVLKD